MNIYLADFLFKNKHSEDELGQAGTVIKLCRFHNDRLI